MKRTSWFCFALGVLLLTLMPALRADDFTEHFIAARAGVVNYVEGSPLVFSGESKPCKPLSPRSQLRAGDRIETSTLDRVELLLNPGSYLRLGPKSRLSVLNTDFGAMQFELAGGSLILESVTFNRKVHALNLFVPSGDLVLLKEGLYRIEVVPSEAVEVLVHKGKLKWLKGGREVGTLTSGKRFNLGVPPVEGELQYVKLDKKSGDVLDRWSRRRAEFLVAVNSRLSPWSIGSVSQSYRYNLRGGWMYNPFFNCYTFVPFDGSFGSPYGFTYALFAPVRTYYRGYSEPSWSAASGGGYPSGRGTTYEQRGSVAAAPSAPAARVETGRAQQESRSGTFDRIRNR